MKPCLRPADHGADVLSCRPRIGLVRDEWSRSPAAWGQTSLSRFCENHQTPLGEYQPLGYVEDAGQSVSSTALDAGVRFTSTATGFDAVSPVSAPEDGACLWWREAHTAAARGTEYAIRDALAAEVRDV